MYLIKILAVWIVSYLEELVLDKINKNNLLVEDIINLANNLVNLNVKDIIMLFAIEVLENYFEGVKMKNRW